MPVMFESDNLKLLGDLNKNVKSGIFWDLVHYKYFPHFFQYDRHFACSLSLSAIAGILTN